MDWVAVKNKFFVQILAPRDGTAGVDLIVVDPNQATQLLQDAYQQLAKAEQSFKDVAGSYRTRSWSRWRPCCQNSKACGAIRQPPHHAGRGTARSPNSSVHRSTSASSAARSAIGRLWCEA